MQSASLSQTLCQLTPLYSSISVLTTAHTASGPILANQVVVPL